MINTLYSLMSCICIAVVCETNWPHKLALSSHLFYKHVAMVIAIWYCYKYEIQKHFQTVMLVGMASEISKKYTYKCVDRSRHNGIKGAKAKCAH